MKGHRRQSLAIRLIVTACTLFLFFPIIAVASSHNASSNKKQLDSFFEQQVCEDCHGAKGKMALFSAREQYEKSGHKNGGHAWYANGSICVRCHTHEGFIAYVETKKIDPKAFIEHPSQPGCFTCHDPHEKGDMSLRTTEPVKLVMGEMFDKGEGNLCASCHSALSKVTDLVKPTAAKDIASFWGSHHGPQADMMVGANGYEFPGKKYFASGHYELINDSCTSCHMAFPKGRFGFSPDMSGHSFNMSGEVHHQPLMNTSGCLGDCHSEMKQVNVMNPDTPVKTFWWHQPGAVFSAEAPADFDQDGKVEPLQAEVEGLLNLFVNTKGTGYLQTGSLPFYKEDGNWNWTRSTEIRPVNHVAALYNYKFVLEDRSRGVHNPAYTIQLLYDTIETLDSGFDTSKRNAYVEEE